MHSLVSVRLLLFVASLIVFGVSIYLIRKNSHSRKGGDEFVRRKKLKTLGIILLFPGVLLFAIAALDNELATDSSVGQIDPVAAAAAQTYTPPVLPKPTESLLVPKDTWKTRLPGTSTSAPASESAAPSPFGSIPADTSTASPISPAAITPMPAPEQIQADLTAATTRVTLNPHDPEAYGARGNIYAAKRDWEAAERDFRSVLTIDPNNTKAQFNLAEMSFMEKKFDMAKAGFAALEKDPELGDLAAYKAFLSDLFGGQMDAASKELDAFNQVGANASYYFANAAWSINHRKPDDARDWLRSATRIYSQEKFKLYATTLFEMGYLPLPVAEN
jgi:tetratricopeptide (TPR) repeat protein